MRFLAFILSLTIFIQSFTLSFADILQFNELIEHAQYHKEQFGDSFLVFLSKHYGEMKAEHQKNHQEELPQHEKLPFQHHLHQVDCSSFMLTSIDFSLVKPYFDDLNTSNFYYVNIYSSIFKSGVFQPPQIA